MLKMLNTGLKNTYERLNKQKSFTCLSSLRAYW